MLERSVEEQISEHILDNFGRGHGQNCPLNLKMARLF